MDPHEDREQQMWELVYGLLPEGEAHALQQQIERDPGCAGRYAEIRRQSEIVAEAARWEVSPLDFPRLAARERQAHQPARATGTEHRQNRRIATRGGELGTRLLRLAALLLVGFVGWSYLKPNSPFRSGTYQRARERVEASAVELHLLGTPHKFANQSYEMAVLTRGQDGQPRSATVSYRMYTDSDQLLVEEQVSSGEDGFLPLAVPAFGDAGRGRLEVQAAGWEDLQPVTHTFDVQPTPLRTSLLVEPVHAVPGETVRYRTVTLASDGRSGESEVRVRFELRDADGRRVPGSVREGITEQGVMYGEYRIPASLPEGTYQGVVLSPEGLFSTTHRELTIGTVFSSASRSEREPGSYALSLADGTLHLRLYPESGTLVAGLPNRVYFRVVDGEGRAIPFAGHLLDEQDREIASLRTRQAGRGVLELVPESGAAYRLRVTQPAGVREEPRFPEVVPSRAVSWTAASGVVREGEPLQLTVWSTRGDEHLMLTAVGGGRVFGRRLLSDSWTAVGTGVWEQVVALPLASSAVGVIQLTADDLSGGSPRRVAERYFYRPPQQRLSIEVDGWESVSADGEVRGTVQIRDERGAGRSAVLGMRVVTSLQPAASDGHSPGLASDFWLAGALPAGFGVGEPAWDPWAGDPAMREALDLLLGAQPARLPTRSEIWLADNRGAVRQRTARTLAAIRTARRADLQRSGWLILLAAGSLLVGGFACRRTRSPTGVPRDALHWTVASCGLVMGLLAMTADVGPGGGLTWSERFGEEPQVAQFDRESPVREASPSVERAEEMIAEPVPAESVPALGIAEAAPDAETRAEPSPAAPSPAPFRAAAPPPAPSADEALPAEMRREFRDLDRADERVQAEVQEAEDAAYSVEGAGTRRRVAEPMRAPAPPAEMPEGPAVVGGELSSEAAAARMASRPEREETPRDGAVEEPALRQRHELVDQMLARGTQPERVVFWKPAEETDGSGQAEFAFRLPEHPGPYRLVIDAHGAGRVGTFRTEINRERGSR